MSEAAILVLLALGLLIAVVALIVALRAASRSRPPARGDEPPLPTDVAGLRAEVQRLRSDAGAALRHLAVVRYDAFGDMGGRLSWTLALADSRGDGVVLTSIAGRSEARTYAKGLAGWRCDQPLSPEEEDAVARARAGEHANGSRG